MKYDWRRELRSGIYKKREEEKDADWWNRSGRHQDGVRDRGSADRQRTAGRKSGHNHRACDDSHREAQDYPAAHGRVFEGKGISSLGIGCFGPVDLHRASPTYGYITSTPKLEWQNVDMVGTFTRALGVPVGFDTDVNAAVLGEVTWGAAKDCDTAIYITVGTGVGVGVYCNGALMHGLVHPEAGHLLLRRHPKDTYAGKCPYHANCLEGLASGPAVEARWGRPAKELADREDVWEMEAFYLAEAVANYVLTYSPQKIVLWGGIMHQSQLFSMVRTKVQELLGGYISNEKILKEIDTYLVPPALGENPGIMGAFALGMREAEYRKPKEA